MPTALHPHNLMPENVAQKPWVLFCSVVDNYGDMGVCWRLARQLVTERNLEVALFVDDFPAMLKFLALEGEQSWSGMSIDGVLLLNWCSTATGDKQVADWLAKAGVVIEAFACELPDAAKISLGGRSCPPVWLNLEYLSAESWPDDCHGLASLITIELPSGQSVSRSKHFFFPGYTNKTGGLLRELNIVEQHQSWQSDINASRKQFLADIAGVSAPATELWVSVFSYPTPALPRALEAMGQQQQAAHCFIPVGRALEALDGLLGPQALQELGSYKLGALTIHIIPFLSQHDYDRLLSLCDFNIVRGEDSFVRAQWAGRPFLWHIYPQQDGVHMDKLEAFLGRMEADVIGKTGQEPQALLAAMWRKWNLDEDCADLWHHLRPQLPQLQDLAVQWRTTISQLPDLSTSLLQFCREHESASN